MNAADDACRETRAAHLQRRSLERGLGLGPDDIERLESMLERRCGQSSSSRVEARYRLTVKRHRGRIHVVYDTWLQCLVTAWPARSYPPHQTDITENNV